MTGFGARILQTRTTSRNFSIPRKPSSLTKDICSTGCDKARKTIRTVDQVVIVEGYLDVIALHQQHRFANAVSPMGTALTEDRLRLLKRLTRRIILALDPDAAGISNPARPANCPPNDGS